jgi:hypothetical protein
MTDANIPEHVHGWYVIDEALAADHHPSCAVLSSYSPCTCSHPEFRMTPERVRPAPVELPCDDDISEAS